MNLVSAHIPALWQMLLWFGCGLLFLVMWRRAAWPILLEKANLSVFLAATVAVLGLWLIKAGIKPGLDFHLLGATALTLMFRPWFAILALALVIATMTANSGQIAAFPANLLLMGVIPVAMSWTIYRLVDRHLPDHLFVYIFVACFFGAGLAISGVGLTATLFAAALGVYPLDYLLAEYLPFYLLLAWGEAFTTGMILTLLVVYKPDWVATFDDRRFLQSK